MPRGKPRKDPNGLAKPEAFSLTPKARAALFRQCEARGMKKSALVEAYILGSDSMAADEEIRRLQGMLVQACQERDTWKEEALASRSKLMSHEADDKRRKAQPTYHTSDAIRVALEQAARKPEIARRWLEDLKAGWDINKMAQIPRDAARSNSVEFIQKLEQVLEDARRGATR